MADDSKAESRETREYPQGPITCCLQCVSVEARALHHRTWTVSILISWTTSIISVILFLVAFSTVGWIRAVKIDEYPEKTDWVGLWRDCVHGQDCEFIAGDITGAGYKVSQALAVLCLLLILLGCVVTTNYMFAIISKSNGKAALALRVSSFVSLLLLIPVFATTWYKQHARYNKSYYDHDKEYSFILAVVSFILEAIGVFFTYTEVLVVQPRLRRPLLKKKTCPEYSGFTNEGFTEITGPSVFPGGETIVLHESQPQKLEAHVRSRMDAKTAYENFAFSEMDIAGSGVAGPLANSMFTSSQDIAKRFTGLTLVEPHYVSPYSKHHSDTMDTSGYATINENEVSHYDGIDSRHSKHSISMQNIFNENIANRANTQEKLVTSVSMYDITDETVDKYYQNAYNRYRERDDSSMQSWRTEKDSHLQVAMDPNAASNSQDNSSQKMTQFQHEPSPVKRKIKSKKKSSNLMNLKQFHDISEQICEPSDVGFVKQDLYSVPDSTQPRKQSNGNQQKTTEQKIRSGITVGNHLQISKGPQGRSNMSLHSITSTATSVVDGCAETEI